MTTTAHERALQIVFNTVETNANRIEQSHIVKAYLQALLDDAETVESVAKAIYLSTSRKGLLWPRVLSWGEYPEKDIYHAEAKAAIATLKRMGGV